MIYLWISFQKYRHTMCSPHLRHLVDFLVGIANFIIVHLGRLEYVCVMGALAPLRLASHHRNQNMHWGSCLRIPLGTINFDIQRVAPLRLKLKEFVMGNFRGYISADGVLTMVMRGCAGLMVKICRKSYLYELQNCWEVKMGKGLL